jgi:hypothetical protein
VGGPVNETMRGPVEPGRVLAVLVDEPRGTVDGSAVVLPVDVVEAAVDGVLVVGDARLEELLLQAVGRMAAASIVTEATRGRRTHVIVREPAGAMGSVRILCRCPASSTWRSAT